MIIIEDQHLQTFFHTLAKVNNLNSFRYLPHVLTVLKDHQDDTDYSFIEELLPWSDQLPEICRSKSKSTNV